MWMDWMLFLSLSDTDDYHLLSFDPCIAVSFCAWSLLERSHLRLRMLAVRTGWQGRWDGLHFGADRAKYTFHKDTISKVQDIQNILIHFD